MVYDVIVVGLGAMGSAAVYQAARRGAKVLGIDQFDPPHRMGSTHGESRLTRMAVGEGDEYIPLVRRTHEIWRELEAETGDRVLHDCGVYVVSPKTASLGWREDGNFAEETANLAVKYGIEHELISAAEVRRRHPVIRLDDGSHAYFEPSGGIVDPEGAIRSQLQLGKAFGAEVRANEPVLNIDARPDGVTVTTSLGKYETGEVVVTAGAWVKRFLPVEYQRPLTVYRQVMYWFEAEEPEHFGFDRFPMLMWIGEKQSDILGAFPNVDGGQKGVKLLTEQFVESCDPDEVKREVSADEIAYFAEHYAAKRLNGLTNRCLDAKACLYTMTADSHFLIDRHPENERVLVASPCSGHGFKHSAAIGESLAQWALGGKSEIDMSRFSFGRFG